MVGRLSFDFFSEWVKEHRNIILTGLKGGHSDHRRLGTNEADGERRKGTVGSYGRSIRDEIDDHCQPSPRQIKKPNLKKALKKVDSLPDKFFGKVDVDLSSLPCLKKVSKEKITANFDSDVVEAIRDLAKKHDVSYTSLMNDVLRKVFVKEKKVG